MAAMNEVIEITLARTQGAAPIEQPTATGSR